MKNVKYQKYDIARKFGVEMEFGSEVKKRKVKSLISEVSNADVFVTKYGLSSNNDYWHVKDDATCGSKGRYGPKGVEVASFIGSGLADLSHISYVAGKLFDSGCKVNDNCGLHIHADVSDLNVDQVSCLIAYWIKIEAVLSMALPLRRHNGEYCKFVFDPINNMVVKNRLLTRTSSYDSEYMWAAVIPKNVNYFDNADRRYNLNLVNYVRSVQNGSSYRKTLELRWPEGSLSPLDIRCWVKLFLSFIETCKNKPMPKDLSCFDLVNTLNCIGFSKSKTRLVIYSEALFELKNWFLNRMLINEDDFFTNYYGTSVGKKHQKAISDVKKTLNSMWSPVRTFA